MDLYLSPHPDDAILSCGGRIISEPGSKTVVNIFSGVYEGQTDWDKLCGLTGRPMKARMEEDKKILQEVNVVSIYLDFYDRAFYDHLSQKEPEERSEKVKRKLSEVINKLSPKRVFCPYGIDHPDHKLTAKIGEKVLKDPIYYEDLPYSIDRSLKGESNFNLSEGVLDEKINLILSYETQLKGFLKLTDSDSVDQFVSKIKNHHLKNGRPVERYFVEK